MHHHQVAQLVDELRRFRRGELEQRYDLGARKVETFFGEEATIENRATQVGHARRLDAVHGLTAGDAVDVQRRVSRAFRLNGSRGRARVERRLQLTTHAIENDTHVLDRAHAKKRHAAMTDATTRRDLEPVDAAMADRDAIGIRRLRDDDRVRAVSAEPALLREPRHARETAAFFVDGPADLDGAVQLDPGAANRLRGVDSRR